MRIVFGVALLVVTLALLLLLGQAVQESGFVQEPPRAVLTPYELRVGGQAVWRFDDPVRGATCYLYGNAISCLPTR